MRRTLKILFLAFCVVALSLFIIRFVTFPTQMNVPDTNVPDKVAGPHIVGGFSIDTPEQATKAAQDGVQVVFQYGQPPSEHGEMGQKLQALHMKVIDGFISSALTHYECHRTWTVKPPPPGATPFCAVDNYPQLSSEDALLKMVEQHLQQVRSNSLIMGYWVLDDWASWDAGSVRGTLIKIHDLIQRFTPRYPAICGFGGSLPIGSNAGWNDQVAANFSPEGCDMVGLYIYAPSVSPLSSLSATDFDWSMPTLLPAIFSSLKSRGWDSAKEPLIGIGQAFGGPNASGDHYWITPRAEDIETQSKSFCAHGASGLVFYAWDDSGFGHDAQTPGNSSEIEAGIRLGISACQQYWRPSR